MKLAFLEYVFMFDPSNTWSHLYEFEQLLTKFFTGQGFEAIIIKAIEGQAGRQILYIRKTDKITEKVEEKTEEKPKEDKGIKESLKKMGKGAKRIIKSKGKIKELPKIISKKRKSIEWYG